MSFQDGSGPGPAPEQSSDRREEMLKDLRKDSDEYVTMIKEYLPDLQIDMSQVYAAEKTFVDRVMDYACVNGRIDATLYQTFYIGLNDARCGAL